MLVVPSKTFTGSAIANASPGQIWERLNLGATWEAISGVDKVLDEVHDASGRLVGFKFQSTAAGKQYVGTASPGPREEGRSLVWNIQTSEIKGSVAVSLRPLGETTDINVTMQVESVSMMASFGFPFIAAAISNGFQETVDNFAAGLG